jgi:hypothetical protein
MLLQADESVMHWWPAAGLIRGSPELPEAPGIPETLWRSMDSDARTKGPKEASTLKGKKTQQQKPWQPVPLWHLHPELVALGQWETNAVCGAADPEPDLLREFVVARL